MLEAIATSIDDSPLNLWIGDNYWLWPTMEILHFIGLSLLLGGMFIIDLRVAGHFRALDPRRVNGLLPLVFAGFAINLVTGVLFFCGDPLRYVANIGFQIKMLLILAAGANAILFVRKVKPVMGAWDATTAPPLMAKSVAYGSLAVWLGVLLLGRLIPYVGSG